MTLHQHGGGGLTAPLITNISFGYASRFVAVGAGSLLVSRAPSPVTWFDEAAAEKTLVKPVSGDSAKASSRPHTASTDMNNKATLAERVSNDTTFFYCRTNLVCL